MGQRQPFERICITECLFLRLVSLASAVTTIKKVILTSISCIWLAEAPRAVAPNEIAARAASCSSFPDQDRDPTK